MPARKKKSNHGQSIIELTARDQKVFVQALLNPPKRNVKLRKAAKRYRSRKVASAQGLGVFRQFGYVD